MKTSKIIMGALVGLMATTVSVKALSVKEACEQDPELYWLENTGECLPVHPCQDDELKNDEKYCNRVFKHVQTHAKCDYLAERYVKAYLYNKGMSYDSVDLDKVNTIGQDYVLVRLSDGRRIEFEFDDANNHTMRSPYLEYARTGSSIGNISEPTVSEFMNMYKDVCTLIYNKTFDKGDDGYAFCRDMTEQQANGFREIFNSCRLSTIDIDFVYDDSRSDLGLWADYK